jgi:hypothetical protein
VFCLPILVGIAILRARDLGMDCHRSIITAAGACLAGFLLPLVATFLYVQNTATLILDKSTGSGLFRGGGRFEINLVNLAQTTQATARDLFVAGQSYYFELPKAEFSDYYPSLALLALAIVLFCLLWTAPRLRLPIGALTLTALEMIVLVGFSVDGSDRPGLRRETVVLVCFYALFAVAWIAVGSGKVRSSAVQPLLIGASGLLLVHHVLVLPANLASMDSPTANVDDRWFALQGDAQSSLNNLVERAMTQDLYLACPQGWSERTPCRFNEVYPAVAGACVWNRLPCHDVYGFDPAHGVFVRLDYTLWTTGGFQH